MMLVSGGAWSAAQPCGGDDSEHDFALQRRPLQIRANGTLMRMFTSQLLRARAVDNNRMWVSNTCKFLQSCLFQFHSFSRHSKTQSIYLKQKFFSCHSCAFCHGSIPCQDWIPFTCLQVTEFVPTCVWLVQYARENTDIYEVGGLRCALLKFHFL